MTTTVGSQRKITPAQVEWTSSDVDFFKTTGSYMCEQQTGHEVLNFHKEELQECRSALETFRKEKDERERAKSMEALNCVDRCYSPQSLDPGEPVDELQLKLVNSELQGRTVSDATTDFYKRVERRFRVGKWLDISDLKDIDETRKSVLNAITQYNSSLASLRRQLIVRWDEEKANSHKQSQIKLLRRRVTKIEDLCERFKREIVEKESTIGRLRADLSAKESRAQSRDCLQNQLQRNETDYHRLTVQLHALENQVAREKTEKDHLSNLLRQTQLRMERDKRTLEEMIHREKRRAEGSEDWWDHLNVQVKERDNIISDLKFELEQSRERLSHLSREQRLTSIDEVGSHQELEKVRRVKELLETKLIHTQCEVRSLKSGQYEHEKVTSEFHKKLEEKDHLINDLREQIKALDSHKGNLAERITQLEDAKMTNQVLVKYVEKEAVTKSRLKKALALEKKTDRTEGLQIRIRGLESQLFEAQTERDRSKSEKDTCERNCTVKLSELQDQMTQLQATNLSLQNYVNLLRGAYVKVFGGPVPELDIGVASVTR